MSNEVKTQGTVIKLGDGASPEVFTTIPNVKNINPVGITRALIDVTNLSSTAREYKLAIPDGQEIQCQANYDVTNAQHTALRTACVAGTTKNFKIILADDSPACQFAFAALVMDWSTEIDIDNVVKLNFKIKPTGAITVTNG